MTTGAVFSPAWVASHCCGPNSSTRLFTTQQREVSAELERLRAEIAAIKKQNAETPDTHNYSEAETRDYFIDLLLKEAGWPLDKKQDREYPVTGMPNEKGEGFVDYVLWGDDGKPVGLVEAKRTKRDARVGRQQAKLYADCLEKQFGQRPVIFYSNGYEHWIWDDQNYPPRTVQGFYEKDELERLIQRRTTRTSLGATEINKNIVERYYQERASSPRSSIPKLSHGPAPAYFSTNRRCQESDRKREAPNSRYDFPSAVGSRIESGSCTENGMVSGFFLRLAFPSAMFCSHWRLRSASLYGMNLLSF
jgi:hypothetical protein